MSATHSASETPEPNSPANAAQAATPAAGNAKIIPLRPPSRWHDPLKLIQVEAPSHGGRIVLWSVCILMLALIVWAAFGQLDIIASADGKLVPQTLVKIVQPAEAGVIRQLLVDEGDTVKAGQVLARLDTTLAAADKAGVASDLATQRMQVRRIQAELNDRPMQPQTGDDPVLYEQVQRQSLAHRQAFADSVEQEYAQLRKAEQEKRSADEVLVKLEQTLPIYQRSAAAYAKLKQDGFIGALAADDKQREATEKARDLDAQRATVAALSATIDAEHKKISQLQSGYRSDLRKELADIAARIRQLQPDLDKSIYKEGLMELKAPQDGVIKDVATTTVGAVVQPGTVLMSLVPQGEPLYADVNIKNEDIGFVREGQDVKIKLAAYPFQQYGMLTGKVIHVNADATDADKSAAANAISQDGSDSNPALGVLTYKARVQLEQQVLVDPEGKRRTLTPGMQAVAEINQGKRTVLEYLLSPVQKALQEAGRER